MNQEVLDMSARMYQKMIGADEYNRNKKGQIVLKPSAKLADEKEDKLTTDIEKLEKKLKSFKETKLKMEEAKKEDSEEKKGKKKKKKEEKKRSTLLKMVFSAPDEKDSDSEEPEMGEYSDKKPRGGKPKEETSSLTGKTNISELKSVYSERFSPVVSFLFDSITDFDEIAQTIKEELEQKGGNTKGMYRSSQVSNLIAANKGKLDAVKELASVSKTVTDLENKKAKDETKDDDNTKLVASIGTKLLRGSLFGDDEKEASNKKKDKKKKLYDDDGEDDDFFKNKKASDKELAEKFRDSVFSSGKKRFELTPYERHIEMEGKYTLWVVADPMNMEDDWKFVAVDKKGHEIKDFKDDYKDLIPRKKDCKMVFDTGKMKVTDKNTSKSYKLVLKG